ncbi:unnamed protein product [Bursaphelenchus okinawaensis]|uniref:Amino acid transporter transmembrane domain-containing protein n=1 Tax=Bursaphelenchus okinawaensis TaxID=465554 RepID=A0A811LAN7_9BILA|nr:unnamed protein product [Bursaphelenchus okinawaensis]CAG9120058.1 unnamed protein product [Bursaphelenchus okinawaensis]
MASDKKDHPKISVSVIYTEKIDHADGYFTPGGEYIKHHGLNWVITGLFLVGDIAGGGLVALPTAMIQSQFWVGMLAMFIMTLVTGYTSYVLGLSWMILIKNWPEYRSHTRKPYPEIGYRACGRRIRNLVSLCITVTQFGVAVVYILLASKNIHDFVQTFFDAELSYCYVILVVSLALLPVTFLKSPQDFWAAVVLAMFTTAAAVILIIVGAAIDSGTCSAERAMPDFRITNYFLALGTVIFSYGGHAAFPTIQHDMKRPQEFTKSTILAFACTWGMYMPVCIIAYFTYGDSLRDSIINNIQTQWIQRVVNMLITVHCILTTTIVINPLNQEAEEMFNVPQDFSMKRVVVRTVVMGILVFVAESVPNFGPLLDLVGGSTLTLSSILLPCIFYTFLKTAEEEHAKQNDPKAPMRRVSWRKAIEKHDVNFYICCFIIFFGILGGMAATFSAVHGLTITHFIAPCYIQPFLKSKAAEKIGAMNCCGHFQNITRLADTLKCSKPDMNFYN